MVSSAVIPLLIDHTVSPSLKLVVYVNEVSPFLIKVGSLLHIFLTQGNTTLTDSHTYKIEACQQHQVSALWNKEKVQSLQFLAILMDSSHSVAQVYPGADVTLSVTAEVG